MVSTVTNRNPAGQRQNVLCGWHQSWGSAGSDPVGQIQNPLHGLV